MAFWCKPGAPVPVKKQTNEKQNCQQKSCPVCFPHRLFTSNRNLLWNDRSEPLRLRYKRTGNGNQKFHILIGRQQFIEIIVQQTPPNPLTLNCSTLRSEDEFIVEYNCRAASELFHWCWLLKKSCNTSDLEWLQRYSVDAAAWVLLSLGLLCFLLKVASNLGDYWEWSICDASWKSHSSSLSLHISHQTLRKPLFTMSSTQLLFQT